MGRCILIGAGDLTVSQIPMAEGDYCIAVDGGMDYLEYLGVEPNLILGDMDSATDHMREAVLQIAREYPEKVVLLPSEKDDTDMLAAIKEGLKRGYTDFRLYAATGGRMDHTLANIQCLAYLKGHNAKGYLMDGNGMMLYLKDESVTFKENMTGTLSLFSMVKETKGVTIKGMKYELEDAVLGNDFPIGVSNVFLGKEAYITVADGELLCILRYD